MKLLDVLRMAWQDFWQRKLRTLLNLTGIVIGCVVLILTAAGATGAPTRPLRSLFDSSENVRHVWVSPSYFYAPEPPPEEIVIEGVMSSQRRERLQSALIEQWKQEHQEPNSHMISQADIQRIQQIPHVDRVIPDTSLVCSGQLAGRPALPSLQIRGVDIHAAKFGTLLVAGDRLTDESSDEVLVSEWCPYRLGFRSDAELSQLIGQEITVQCHIDLDRLAWVHSVPAQQFGSSSPELLAEQAFFAATFKQLIADVDSTTLSDEQKQMLLTLTQDMNTSPRDKTELLLERRFKVRGIVRADEKAASISKLFDTWFHHSQGDLFVSSSVAVAMQLEDPQRQDFANLDVIVDSANSLQSVSDELTALRFNGNSMLWLWEQIQTQIATATSVVYGVAAAILLASALGISNTLLISVLQRTSEFGILKAVGAKDRDLVFLMLSEGLLLGATGAGLGLGLSGLIAFLGEDLLARYVGYRTGEEIVGNWFQFTPLPILAVFVGAIVLCVTASILPAWRAARLDPVVAMRRT